MRHALVLITLLASWPAPAEVPAAAPPPMDFHLDVPRNKGPQHVNVLIREFPVGGFSGWHRHPGIEIAYLVAGEMTLEQTGQPTRVLHPGDSFLMPRGVAHNGANIGNVPARLVITYVIDEGGPLRTPALVPVPPVYMKD